MKKTFPGPGPGGTASFGTASAQGNLTGAGASFPFPLYSKMFAEYKKSATVDVNYQTVGSGSRPEADSSSAPWISAASDNAMSDDTMKDAPGKLMHIPTAIGAVVPSYNLPGVTAPLKFTGKVLADIYLGKIKTLGRQVDCGAESRRDHSAPAGHGGAPQRRFRHHLRVLRTT